MTTFLRGHDPGDEVQPWIAALYQAHAPALLRYLSARVGHTAGEDLTAETFVTAIRRHETFDSARGTPGAWLFGIATNALRDHARREAKHLRTRARLHSEAPLGGPDNSDVDDRIDASVLIHRLVPGLLDLSPVDRDILLLTSWVGLSPTEIGVALDLNPGAVRTRLHRIRHRLRATLEATPHPPGADVERLPTGRSLGGDSHPDEKAVVDQLILEGGNRHA